MQRESIENSNGNGLKLINLNKIEVLIGILVALITLGNTYGIIAVMPYRLAQVEKQNGVIQAQFDDLKKENNSNKELLIRIDERLKVLQENFNQFKTTMRTSQ
jgi:hypothetical protein